MGQKIGGAARSITYPAADFDLARLVHKYGDVLARRAFRLTRDQAAAGDLLHDCYERALNEGPAGLTDERRLAWLYVVMRNLFFDRIRANNRHCFVPLAEDVVAPDPDLPPDLPEVSMDEVRTSVARLSPTLRATFEWHVFEGLSYADIAARLRLPQATVGTRLMRARAKLRDHLTNRLGSARGEATA